MKKILITGITGQDGSFLAKKLIQQGHKVYGAVRRGSTPKYGRLLHLNILDEVTLLPIEVTEFSNVFRTLRDLKPDMIYNLAAQSFVQDSFVHPHLTSSVNYLGVLNFLESINLLGLKTSFYQASTSEMFGEVLSDPQDEFTPFNPMSPYAVSKCAAHQLVANYRKSYGINASSGILFNHESELRGREFVTRKITYQIAEMVNGRKKPIELGNLSSVRDWGYAPEYVDAMILIGDSKTPNDFVVATNSIFSVRDFLKISSEVAGFKPVFEGEGLEEKCIDALSGRIICEVNKKYFRPSDVVYLRGSYKKINKELGWTPKIKAEKLAEIMTVFDLEVGSGQVENFGI
jgi:GDPmannose 4,6-dehydratase